MDAVSACVWQAGQVGCWGEVKAVNDFDDLTQGENLGFLLHWIVSYLSFSTWMKIFTRCQQSVVSKCALYLIHLLPT